MQAPIDEDGARRCSATLACARRRRHAAAARSSAGSSTRSGCARASLEEAERPRARRRSSAGSRCSTRASPASRSRGRRRSRRRRPRASSQSCAPRSRIRRSAAAASAARARRRGRRSATAASWRAATAGAALGVSLLSRAKGGLQIRQITARCVCAHRASRSRHGLAGGAACGSPRGSTSCPTAARQAVYDAVNGFLREDCRLVREMAACSLGLPSEAPAGCSGRAPSCFPSGSLTVASQICVVRPPCTSRASQVIVPSVALRRKFVFSSIVVKPVPPSGRRQQAAVAAAVSASATTVPACT